MPRPSDRTPTASMAPAAATAAVAMTGERRATALSGGVAPSRTAAMGGTRVARTAGTTPATSVTTVPTTSETTIVRVAKTVSPWGMSSPAARKRAIRPFDSASPRPRPASEAAKPMIPASAMTERITWRREAPRVRSVASSRERWATVMDSVLKMTKAPTKRATPPKASSRARMNAIAWEIPCLSRAACSSPVVACAVAGSRGAISRASSACETPGSAATWIAWKPLMPSTERAVGMSKTAIVAPPSESTSPNRARPVTRKVRTGPSLRTPISSPTA